MASMSYSPVKNSENLTYRTSASDLLRSSSDGFSSVPLKTLERALFGITRRDLTVSVKLRKVKKVKPKPVTLEFEKPLIALQKQIIEVRKMVIESGLDFGNQILSLESNYEQALKKLYMHLTPTQRMNIARHPNRPTEKFVELHGNRSGYEDPRSMDTEKKETPELEHIEELWTLAHSESDLNESMIEKLEREVGHEYSEAAKAMGLKDKLVILHEEFAKTWNPAGQLIDSTLQDKMQKLNDEFNQNLPQAPNYASLKFKLEMLKEISEARDLSEAKFEEFTNQPHIQQKVDELNEKNKMSTNAIEFPFGEDENSIKGIAKD